MVVDGGSSTRCALLRDKIAMILRDNGWARIIPKAAVRDSAEMDEMGIEVFCLGTSTKESVEDGAGRAGKTIQFGGVEFMPGMFAYADPDGLLVEDERYT